MRGITLEQAQRIVTEAQKLARTNKAPPLAVVVLDNGGHLKAAVCDDGCGTLRINIAQGKANAAIGMGFNTRQFHQLIARDVLPEIFSNAINGAAGGNFIPLPGGVLITSGQSRLGAVGISGANSNTDEEIAIAAIRAAGLEVAG